MADASHEPPSGAGDLARDHPAVWKAYADLGRRADGFFDGFLFDPDDVEGYLRQLRVSSA